MKPSKEFTKKICLTIAIVTTLLALFSVNAQAAYTSTAFPIPDTGQTKCYDMYYEIPCPVPGDRFYGQDGNYLINPPSYTKLDENGNDLPDDAEHWVMIRDNVTGLIWEIKTDDDSIHDKDNKYTWYDSNPETNGGNAGTPGEGTDTEDFIATLNADNFGGYSDWRLPTLEELASIVNMGRYDPSMEKTFFPHVMSAFYWSSTSYALNTGYAWGVDFYGGGDGDNAKDSSYYVRAVRGGQCRSFDSLVINGDETVTDMNTGLMWQRTSFESKMNWQKSLSNCEILSFAGYNDWRLPTREELRSIVYYININPATNKDFFPNTLSAFYWSSTSLANYTGNAWGVHFYHGYGYRSAKDSSYFVRAVRGGQYRSFDHLVIWSPNQGAIWNMNDEIPITWDTKTISGNVNIYLSRQGGRYDTFDLIAENTINDGSYTWTATGDPSVNCVLKIEPINEPEKMNMQGFFTIKNPCFFTSIPDLYIGDTAKHELVFTCMGPENEIPELSAVSSNTDLIPTENIHMSGEDLNYTLTFYPKVANQSGITTITIEMVGQNCTSTDDIHITILPENDPPLIHLSESPFYTKENMALKLSEFDETWVSITDEDAADHPIQLTLCAINGVLNLTQTSSLTIISGKNNSGMMCIEGTIATINNSLKHLVFVPSSNYWGHAGIDIKTSDQGFSGSDGTKTDRALLHIYINPEKPCTHSFPIPDSGQTTCSNNNSIITCPQAGEEFYGQDATYSINTQSFTKLDSKGNDLPDSAENWAMVRDNVTGLIWEVKTDDAGIHDKYNRYTWYDSNPNTNGGYNGKSGDMPDTEDFITTLNAEKFGGYSDWRIPNVKELATINSLEKYKPSINKNYFPHTMSAFYWSSTSSARTTGNAWGVSFYHGYHRYYNAKDSSYFVRAVRGGQCRSFDHLVINSDETVTDVNTGLMWQKTSFDLEMNWQMALSNCESLSFAGYNDWRLPTKEELRSIVDYDNYNPAINRQIFSDTWSAFYWSSTSYADGTGRAWGVNFYVGNGYDGAKDSSYFVRAVRGGQYRSFDHLVIWSPNQGSLWNINDNIPISWDPKDIPGNVNIFMSWQGGKENTYEIIAENTENDGAFDWLATKASVNCMLKIEPVDDPSKSTINGLFTISGLNISPISNYSTNEDIPALINFTIGVSRSTTLTVKATSSNTTLLPEENLCFSQSNTSSITLNATQSINYTLMLIPSPDQSGTSIITITANNSKGEYEITNFQVSVIAIDDPPIVAKPIDDIHINEDALIQPIDLSQIFFDADDPISLSLQNNSNPGLITATLSDNMIYFDLCSNLHGQARITVLATGNQQSISESFNITVNAKNDSPILAFCSSLSVTEDQTSLLKHDLLSVTDIDNSPQDILYTIISQPLFGTLARNSSPLTKNETFTQADINANLLSYTHNGDEFATRDEFTFIASDGDLEISETSFFIHIELIDDPPIINQIIQNIQTNEDSSEQLVDLSQTFTDSDSPDKYITISILNHSNPSLVTATLTDKILKLNFQNNQYGEAILTLLANSNGKQITTAFTINVMSIDDLPIVKNPVPDIWVNEDAPATFIDLTPVFFDADGDPISITIQENTNPNLVIPALFEKNLTLEFLPNQHGEACITLLATANGRQISTLFNINVAAIDDPMIIYPVDDIMVDEDAPDKFLDLSQIFIDIDNVLVFDIQSNANPRLLSAGLTEKTMTLQFKENQHGNASITILATSNNEQKTLCVMVTVISIEDPPVVANPIEDIIVDEDAPQKRIDLSNVFSDGDNDSITMQIAAISDSSLFTATLFEQKLNIDFWENQHGESAITIQAIANQISISDTFHVTINSVNDAPVLSACLPLSITEDQFGYITQNHLTVTDVESKPQNIQFKITTLPSFGRLTQNGIPLKTNDTFTQADINAGNLSYLHNGNDFATKDEFTFKASDGSLEISETVFVIKIILVDEPPVINQHISDILSHEDSKAQLLDLSQVFTDVDNDDQNINIAIVTHSNPTLVKATLSDKFFLHLHYQHNMHGAAIITLVASSNGKQVTDSFTITVLPIDDPPVVKIPLSALRINEDDPGKIIDLAPVFFDVDNDPIAIAIQSNSNPALVTAKLDEKILNLTFAENQHGYACITLIATANEKRITHNLEIFVASIDDPIVMFPMEDIIVNEDDPPKNIDLGPVFFDPDHDEISIRIQSNSNPDLLTATLSNKILQLNFRQNQNGFACIGLIGISTGSQVTGCVNIHVKSIDDPPFLANPIEDIIVDEDALQQFIDLSHVFVDIDHPLSISIQENTAPDLIGITLTSSGMTLVFHDNQHGKAEITLCATANKKTVTDSFRVIVNSINDAPILEHSTTILQEITEDTRYSDEKFVSTLIGSIKDNDRNNEHGFAVFSYTGKGHWQYSQQIYPQTIWNNFIPIADNQALLIGASMKIRYVPDGANGEQACFHYYAWDQTSGYIGQMADVFIRGDATAFSTESGMVTITVTSMNDRPTLDLEYTWLDDITEDDTQHQGITIAQMIGDSIDDPDTNARFGIALTHWQGIHSWQYSLNSSSMWQPLTEVNPFDQALLLSDSDSIRYLPNGITGEQQASITFYAWDQSNEYPPGSIVDKDMIFQPDTDAFSIHSDQRFIRVESVNDAPVLIGKAPVLYEITEEDVNNDGILISSFINSAVTDVDKKDNKGIAIFNASSEFSDLQYFINAWKSVGQVDQQNALLLSADHKIRCQPNLNRGETVSIHFHAWDGKSRDSGSKVPINKTGGTSHFSRDNDIAFIKITNINDAPELTNKLYRMTAIDEDPLENPGNSIANILGKNAIYDKDGVPVTAIAVTGVDNTMGKWFYLIADEWKLFTEQYSGDFDISQNSVVLVGGQRIKFMPNPDANGSSSFTFRAWDMSNPEIKAGEKADTRINGNTTAFSAEAYPASIMVLPVNDPPTVTVTPAAITIMEDDNEQSIELTEISSGAANEEQKIHITAFSDKPDLIGELNVTDHNLNDTATITFTPKADCFGTSTIIIEISDGISSIQKQIPVNVQSVNDPPVFTPGSSQHILEDAKPQEIQWASDIDAGQNENQSVAFIIQHIAGKKSILSQDIAISSQGIMTYAPQQNECGETTYSVYLKDTGGSENNGKNTSDAFPLTISIACVNDQPKFDVDIPDIDVDEDCGEEVFFHWAKNISPGTNETEQLTGLRFNVLDNNNPDIFQKQPEINPNDGTLRFTPLPDANGTANLTVVLKDNGGTNNGGIDISEKKSLSIQIKPVNDAPSFTMARHLTVNEDAGEQTIDDWAKDISPGPENESNQSFNFVTSTSNHQFFSEPPQIFPSGRLTFTTAKNVNGTVTITVVLQDEGRTENGGKDKSEEQSFTITVNEMDEYKAIILAGGFNVSPAFVDATDKAHEALINLGYMDIQYFRPDTLEDYAPTIEHLKTAIQWASDADRLILFIAGHAEKTGNFRINENQYLTATTLDQWLDELHDIKPQEQIVIYDACYSGSFIPQLMPDSGKKRYILSSATSDQTALFEDENSFSYHFWSTISTGHYVDTAFFAAKNKFIQRQTAQMEADGLTGTNSKSDYQALDQYCLNFKSPCLSEYYTPCDINPSLSDQYEPDHPYEFARIFNPYTKTAECHNFYNDSADWVIIFAPQKDHSFKISIENPGIDCDPMVEIYPFNDPTQPILTQDEGFAGESEIFNWYSTQKGIFYVKVSNNNSMQNSSNTAYTLKIIEQYASGNGTLAGWIYGLSSSDSLDKILITVSSKEITDLDYEIDKDSIRHNDKGTLFHFSGIRPGPYQLKAQLPKYQSFEWEAQVESLKINHETNIIFKPLGDVNNNNEIDINDLIISLKIVAGFMESIEDLIIRADVNNDQHIGLEDVIYIRQQLTK